MDILALKQKLDEEGVIFSFSGIISQDVLVTMAEALENEFKIQNVDMNLILKIFAVFTEQMQNIMNFSAYKPKKVDNIYESIGVCVVGFDDKKKKYYVGSGNVINESDKIKIKEKIDTINSLNKDELKEYYKKLRKSGEGVHKRGAGLGFIDMARKSSEALEYDLKPINNEQFFYQIKVYI